ALAGDRVKVEGDQVYVNGKVINEPYIQEQIDAAKKKGTTYNSMNFKVENGGIKEVIVPEGTVFVLGDNRPFSKDSRDPEVGFVSIDDIVGRADLVFWPPSKIKIIKHPDGMLE
ncbi:MAG: signal peptidase I, partial [Bacillales bacterium]